MSFSLLFRSTIKLMRLLHLIGNIGDDMNCSNEDVIYCSDEEGKTASSVTAVDKSRLENVEDVSISLLLCVNKYLA